MRIMPQTREGIDRRREGRESEKTRAALMKVCVLGIVVEIGRGEGEGGV